MKSWNPKGPLCIISSLPWFWTLVHIQTPPPLLDFIQPTHHCDTHHHHSLVIIWREVSDALPSPSSITSLATKTKIVFEFKNQHIYSLFCEDRDWVISVSHPILIFDRNFSRNIDSWQSVLLVKKDIFGGAERGERWFMSQDLPSLIFTSYFILLVFCTYLSHFKF